MMSSAHSDAVGNGVDHETTNGNHQKQTDQPVPTNLTNASLESKLKQLREESNRQSQLLTQKLATSQSGQNLLHMGTSLSTLPPDLHSLLQHLHPVLSQTETCEREQLRHLKHFEDITAQVQACRRRAEQAEEAADLYRDLQAAERTVRRDIQWRRYGGSSGSDPMKRTDSSHHRRREEGDDEEEGDKSLMESHDELDHASSLERAAHITLTLVEDLHAANESLTAALKSEADTEQAQFLVKLAPRVRRLESDATQCLSQRMELFLQRIQDKAEDDSEEDLLLMLGHCMRGLALLGRSRDVENIFARTAIMPVVRSKVSMGRLDEGGSRGECAGLFSLLDDMATTIAATFGPVLRMAETMFDVGSSTDVDMLTAGVWVPIATALMADPGIKMAIFSPGIASILQANYTALDTFLSELAGRMLSPGQQTAERVEKESPDEMNGLAKYYQPAISPERIQQAQDRIYNHPKTAEFTKKWNLPIYYQLRFGECCTRLNKAVDQTKREGWIADVFTGSEEQGDKLRNSVGFELTLFLELYDILLGLWRPDVILLPLSNRFLRGAIQLLGRVVSFISEGMEGTILFGEEPVESESSENGGMDASGSSQHQPPPMIRSRKPYCWGESEEDVAAVAWELTVLESCVRHDYASVIAESLSRGDSSEDGEQSELRRLVEEVLKEASDEITPVIDKAWNGYVVDILTAKCSAPLAAVKGVAATYRMTNRPPPTQASPFVATILRPLKEFGQEFADRTPDRVGAQWKQQIVATVSDRYAAAVRELLATVQRTEAALKSRKTRRAAAGGMSDGEKVKLQVHLDCAAFSTSVREAGVDPAAVPGLSELAELTAEGEKLLHHQN